jgi:hypothetical protein
MAEATIPLHEAGLWKKTFLGDIMLTRKGKAWLARYGDELASYVD